jgi:hypothetical protein
MFVERAAWLRTAFDSIDNRSLASLDDRPADAGLTIWDFASLLEAVMHFAVLAE